MGRYLVLGAIAVVLAIVACGADDNDLGSGNPAGVGLGCARNEDCPTQNCYLGPGGGYCTTNCADEGSTTQCPTDTVCKPIQGGARRCLLICGSGTACGTPDAGCGVDFC